MQQFYLGGPSGDTKAMLRMNEVERESKFDYLVSTEYMELSTQLLTRIPSMKNMKRLRSLLLQYNKITMIAPGDFKGADSLVVLALDGNSIVSVAISAFTNLAAMRVRPEEFKPKNDDGSNYKLPLGAGAFASSKQVHPTCVPSPNKKKP